MSYQVLARKWRPRNFSELVGQDHVVKVLGNGLAEGRIHHAFLFTGTRGVGKTTLARILAKSLNCLEGVSAEPCGQCEHCVAIDEGRFVDLLEIDAASRTKVDDTREILDNVQYAPARGRYKVYLIDEVHMLSISSFNALLKTLEEPPDHVKFVLATTDPQKIPVTILSRCLQFNLRRLTPAQISGQIERILAAEDIEFEADAVVLLSRAADGSMRDGLSLLDQALAGGGPLKTQAVREMLGSVEQRHVHGLLEALVEQDPAAAINVVGEVFSLARDLGRLLDDLAEALHRVALIQQLPDYRDDSRDDWDSLVALAARLDPEDVQLFYQIVINGRSDLKLAPSDRTGCEMTVLRLFAFQPQTARSGGGQQQSSDKPRRSSKASSAPAAQARVPSEGRGDAAEPVAEAIVEPTADWPRLLAQLELNGSVKTVASMLGMDQAGPPEFSFSVAADEAFLITDRFREALQQALSARFGSPVRIRISTVAAADLETPAALKRQQQAQAQSQAEQAIADDPLVESMRKRFDAEVIPESIRPLDSRNH